MSVARAKAASLNASASVKPLERAISISSPHRAASRSASLSRSSSTPFSFIVVNAPSSALSKISRSSGSRSTRHFESICVPILISSICAVLSERRDRPVTLNATLRAWKRLASVCANSRGSVGGKPDVGYGMADIHGLMATPAFKDPAHTYFTSVASEVGRERYRPFRPTAAF